MTDMIRILKNVVKFISIAIAFTLTIEFSARIDDAIRFGAPFLSKYTADRLRTIDKEGLQINIPNARFEKWRNNSLGYRGQEISQKKLPGMLRVVCLGASESYGLYESPDKEWPAQLDAILPSQKYQVINASVAGMTLATYKTYLKKYVLPIKPDIIICFINPFFYASGFDNVLKNSASHTKYTKPTEKKTGLNLTESIISNIRFLPKIKQVAKKTAQNSFPELLQRYQMKITQKQVEELESRRLGGRIPKDAVPEDCINNYKNDLSDLVHFIESSGAKVMLCTYPTLISGENFAATYPVMFLDARRFSAEYSFRGMVDVLNELNEISNSVAIEQGTIFFDCQALIPKTTEYFADNVHYTDNGARLIAEGIATLIRNKVFEPMFPTVKKASNNRHELGG